MHCMQLTNKLPLVASLLTHASLPTSQELMLCSQDKGGEGGLWDAKVHPYLSLRPPKAPYVLISDEEEKHTVSLTVTEFLSSNADLISLSRSYKDVKSTYELFLKGALESGRLKKLRDDNRLQPLPEDEEWVKKVAVETARVTSGEFGRLEEVRHLRRRDRE